LEQWYLEILEIQEKNILVLRLNSKTTRTKNADGEV